MRKLLIAFLVLPLVALGALPAYALMNRNWHSEGMVQINEADSDSVSQGLTDAVIRYERKPNGPAFIRICRDWGNWAGGCARNSVEGILYDGEDSLTKYGWADVDGFYHPSTLCYSQASIGHWIQFSHSANRTGWVKTFGVNGSTWTVQITCY